MATQTDLHAAISTSRVGALSYTLIDNKGPTTMTSGRYWHLNLATVDTGGLGALATAINTSIGVTTHLVTCTFSATNLTYTFAGNANFTLNLDAVLAAAMGFASGALSGASTYTSTKRPLYCIRPLVAGQSSVSDDYGPANRIKARIAEDGLSQYSISPLTMPVYNDWMHMYEADAPLANGGTYSGGSGHAVMTRNATATMPWAWQDFWGHVRAEEYFAWCSQTAPPTSATATLYKMRGESGNWQPIRAVPDYGLWNLRFQALKIGTQ